MGSTFSLSSMFNSVNFLNAHRLGRCKSALVLAGLIGCLEVGAAPPAKEKMVLHDNIKLVTRQQLVYPEIMTAYIRFHENLCKGLGHVIVPFNEKNLDKLYGKETVTYLSGGSRTIHDRFWSLAWIAPGAERKCDFGLEESESIEVVTDERKVQFHFSSNGGKTEVLNKSPVTVKRAKLDREKRLGQLRQPGSLWARRMFVERTEAREVNSIPCVMTANGLGCLFEKMPYHVPTGKPLLIQSELSSPEFKAQCESTPLGVLEKSYGKLASCAFQVRMVATEIQLDVNMPPGIFDIPRVAKEHPIKYVN